MNQDDLILPTTALIFPASIAGLEFEICTLYWTMIKLVSPVCESAAPLLRISTVRIAKQDRNADADRCDPEPSLSCTPRRVVNSCKQTNLMFIDNLVDELI